MQRLELSRSAKFFAIGVGLSGIALVRVGGSSPAKWVPYHATITETTISKDSSGKETRQETVSEQNQAADGSLQTIYLENGRPVTGKLVFANGENFALNYSLKQAIPAGKDTPRGHSAPQSDAPLGSQTIAGLPCTVYPMHSRNLSDGVSGSICVDLADDIPLKIEINTNNSMIHQDYIQQVLSIELNPANAKQTQNIPEGFTKLTSR